MSRCLMICVFMLVPDVGQSEQPVPIGSRREPLVDDTLIDSLAGSAQLLLHHPVAEELAVVFDEPWEGNTSGYATVIQEEDRYRLYYRGHRYLIGDGTLRQAQTEAVCYAESEDGIHWVKPSLGLFRWPGVDDNNIIWMGSPEAHNFAPFIDTNPDCPADQRYKAIGGTVTSKGLWTFCSEDGIHWNRLSTGPVVTKGAFDSHNTVFWDDAAKRYCMYVRIVADSRRQIGLSYSPDFARWTEPVPLQYPDSPPQQMYTNQILPYYRAPHVLFGFPTRYIARPLTEHVQSLPPVDLRRRLMQADQRSGTDLTDGLFMSSRNGISFRRWDEAFLRPGPQTEGRWMYGDNYQVYGLYEARSKSSNHPARISMLFEEGAWRDDGRRLRRYSIRQDGFVSLNASFAGGEMTSRPVTFEGTRLSLNYATSAAGSLKVAVLAADGSPIPGYTVDDATELYGDSTAQTVTWAHGSDVSSLAGRPIRLQFQLRDADLYSFRFESPDEVSGD